MRKLIAVLLAVLMLSALCVSVFAGNDPIVSPTTKPEYLVEFDDYAHSNPGSAPAVSNYTVPVGDTIRFEADPTSPYEFVGFTIDGEYTIVEGSLDGPYIVIKPASDLVVIAEYEGVPIVTTPSDTSHDGPQTGSEITWIAIAFGVLVVCAVAAVIISKRFVKKEN